MEGNIFNLSQQPSCIDFVLTGKPDDEQRALALLSSKSPEARLSAEAMLAGLDLKLQPGSYRYGIIGTRYYVIPQPQPSFPSH